MDSTDIQYEILMQCNLSQFIFWSGLNRKFYKWRNNTQLWQKKFTGMLLINDLPFTMRGYRMYDKIWTKVFSFFRQFDKIQPIVIRSLIPPDDFHTWLEDDRNFNYDLINYKLTYESTEARDIKGLTLVVTYYCETRRFWQPHIEKVFIATLTETLTILYKYYYFKHIAVESFQDKWNNNGDRFRWERTYFSPDLF
jgi:hypothetical protein